MSWSRGPSQAVTKRSLTSTLMIMLATAIATFIAMDSWRCYSARADQDVHFLLTRAASVFREFKSEYGRFPSSTDEAIARRFAPALKWHYDVQRLGVPIRGKLVRFESMHLILLEFGDLDPKYVAYRLEFVDNGAGRGEAE